MISLSEKCSSTSTGEEGERGAKVSEGTERMSGNDRMHLRELHEGDDSARVVPVEVPVGEPLASGAADARASTATRSRSDDVRIVP